MNHLKKEVLQILKNFFACSLSNFAIIDSDFNILWSNEEKFKGNLSESSFKIISTDDENLGFPILKESFCRLKVLENTIYVKIQPIIDDDNTLPSGYVISCAQPYDIFGNNMISKNYVASIREHISGVAANISALNFSLEKNEMLDEIKYVEGTISNCYQLLSSVSNANEINYYFSQNIKVTSRNTSSFLEDIVNTCQSYLRNDCVITSDIDPNIFMALDFDRFSSAVINLIINGVKYNMSEEKEIHVKFKKQNNEAILTVSDNGVGLPHEAMKNMSSISSFNKLSVNGREGLGLAVVKLFSEQFDGSIQYQTQVNEGTSFFIRLPIVEKSEGFVKASSADYIKNRFSPIYLLLAKVVKIKYF